MSDKPLPVYLAPDVRAVTWVVNKLLERGIPAEMKPDIPTTTVDPLTGATTMADPAGFEVIVTDPAKVEEARALVAEWHVEVESRREARAARTGTVSAECEECAKASDWPAAAMGSTQTCPHCLAYMDIPDPDDDWADLDVGEDEDEAK